MTTTALMTDDGDGGRRLALNGVNINNIVLKSSYAACTRGTLSYTHLNPGFATAHGHEISELFKGVNIHEYWLKGWHINKTIKTNGYKVVRADRSDGRRGG
jgi:hypothetical protein